MFAFFKALLVGICLSAIIALFVGSSGSTGGFLNVFDFQLLGYQLYWSWALFLIGTALAFGIFLMMA